MAVKKEKAVFIMLISFTTFLFFFYWNLMTEIECFLGSLNLNISYRRTFKHKFKSLEEIHKLIKNQIHNLQEKGDCKKKKILLCRNVESFSGLGSNLHRYGVCMQVAYGLGRTFFIHQDEYSHFNGIFKWVQPESLKCGHLKNKILLDKSLACNAQDISCYLSNGYDINNTHRIIEFNTVSKKFPYPRHIPGTIPEELNENLLYLGIKSPWLWFTSQFLAYLLLRPNAEFNKTFYNLKQEINYSLPIIGFHIRHGDKITSGEAEYINETVFVNIAEDYFSKHNVTSKRVYIATDDIPAIKVVNKLAPEFITTGLPHNYLSSGLGNYLVKRFPKEILESTLLDLYFLTNTNYLVCDVTSNLCRLVYELKQGLPPYKQDDILKPVGEEKEVYYRWHDFVYPSSLWIVLSNKPSINQRNIWRKFWNFLVTRKAFLKYNKNVYTKVETVQNNFSDGWYMKKINNVVKESNKYVYTLGELEYICKNDLMEWPGKPSYHFFP
ncbi:alpha-(1,6)-fucosyltransferase [Hydra vulgaris]|uniref:alpha-(1,6)-fucosyltransferase n=1 Tax=Hydra vulgaris TaxID=6087 RepID=UPI001F5E5188|nr:alpha-(1,6)-fucosyltransferase-like [Hydra vulgaris]